MNGLLAPTTPILNYQSSSYEAKYIYDGGAAQRTKGKALGVFLYRGHLIPAKSWIDSIEKVCGFGKVRSADSTSADLAFLTVSNARDADYCNR